MTAALIYIGGGQDDPDDLSFGQISWPDTVNTMYVSGGEQILRNRGLQTVYTSSDGATTLQFGSYYYNGSFVNGSPTQGVTPAYPNYFDGPWAVVPYGTINHGDPLFEDIEIWGDASWSPDPSHNEYIITPRVPGPGQQQIYSSQIVPNAVTHNHIHPAGPEAGGKFDAGAAIAISGPSAFGNVQASWLYWFSTNPGTLANWNDQSTNGAAVLWDTRYGDGDSLNLTGGLPGAYKIVDIGNTINSGDHAYYSYPPIYTANLAVASGSPYPNPRCWWPNNNPAGAMIAFCTLFPGGSSQLATPPSGGNLNGDTYRIRYCYYKVLTLQSMVNRGAITAGGTQGSATLTLDSVTNLSVGEQIYLRGGAAETAVVKSISGTTVTLKAPIAKVGHKTAGWGSFTQTIETPLSTAAVATIGGGTTNQIQFTMPLVPTGWDGVNVYASRQSMDNTYGPLYQQVSVGAATSSDHIQIGIQTIPQSVNGASTLTPSYGFNAWPSGTLLDKDPLGPQYYLKKWAHVSLNPDPGTQNYLLSLYDGTDASLNSGNAMRPAIVLPTHPKTEWSAGTASNASTLAQPNYLLALNGNGSAFVYVPNGSGSGTSGSSISNGGMTLEVDSNGNLVSVGGAATRLSTNPFGGNAVNSGIVGYGSNQTRGYIQLTLNTSLGQIGGMYALCTVVFVYPYSGTPFVLLQNLSSGHIGQYSYSQAGIAVSTSTNGFTVYNTVPFNPQTTGAELYFYYFVLG